MNWKTAISGLILVSAAAYADQFTFINDIITWTKNSYDYPTQQGPTNWTSPVDYVNGHMYARYEVLQKPSDKTVAVQCCMWQDSYTLESCSACKTYSAQNVYYFDWGVPAAWWKLKALDYTRAFQRVYLMHKDGSCSARLLMTSACGSYCYTGTDIDDHVPIQFKVHIIMVSNGGTLDPPATWTGNPWGSVEDTTPPLVSSVSCSAPDRVSVTFNESLDNTSARTAANYVISGGVTVTSASLTGNTVTLATSSVTAGVSYTLTINNVKDAAGNAVAANTVKNFIYIPFSGWQEDFEDGTADGFVTGQGTWNVSGGGYVNSGSGRTSCWYGDQSFEDISYSVDITPGSGTDVWSIFRVQDASNYYLYTLQTGKLYKLVGGNYTELASGTAGYTAGTKYTIKTELAGSSIKIYKNGSLALSHTDATISTGYVGFGSNGATATFDNAMVPSSSGIRDIWLQGPAGEAVCSICPSPVISGRPFLINLASSSGVESITFTGMDGRLIADIPGSRISGRTVAWDGRGIDGRFLESGIYIAKIRINDTIYHIRTVINR